MSVMIPAYARAAGSAAMTSFAMVVCRRTLCVSTTGDSALTMMVSSIAPIRSSALMVAVKDPVSSIPSRLYVVKPGSAKVRDYVPDPRLTMRYWPVGSVVATRTFSMRTLLVASTVTPGRTAPDGSLTVPVIEAWAKANVGSKANQVNRETRMPIAAIAAPLGGGPPATAIP